MSSKTESYDIAVMELMRAFKRFIYESDERIKRLEHELEMLRNIDESILLSIKEKSAKAFGDGMQDA